jgi:hypothetical protein
MGEVCFRVKDTQGGPFMGLMEKLRKAEEQGKYAARQAFERAKHFSEDTERRIRQKMRIYPPGGANNVSADAGQQTPSNDSTRIHSVQSQAAERGERPPIISVHGEDVEEADKVA